MPTRNQGAPTRVRRRPRCNTVRACEYTLHLSVGHVIPMLGRLLALFLITPVIELALLIQLGDWIGFWPTVGLIVITGVTGTFLAKREGLSVWRRFNERLRGGDLPGRELLDGVIILIAGALLITPGVLTDLAGFIGLIPPTRSLLRGYLNKRIQAAAAKGSVHFSMRGFESFGGAPTSGGSEPIGGAEGSRSRGPSDGGERVGGSPSSGEAGASRPAGDDAWGGQARERPHHRE